MHLGQFQVIALPPIPLPQLVREIVRILNPPDGLFKEGTPEVMAAGGTSTSTVTTVPTLTRAILPLPPLAAESPLPRLDSNSTPAHPSQVGGHLASSIHQQELI